jgi:beta-phosphoglucomutase
MTRKKQYKAIIFDMDGTIIDSNGVWHTVVDMFVKSKKHNITTDDLHHIHTHTRGLALVASCSLIKDKLNLEDSLEDLIEEKTNRALALYKDALTFISGFQDFFKEVEKHGLKVAIATNSEDRTLAITTDILQLDNFFGEHIYNISHVNNVYKPYPDLYLYAAKRIGVNPEECIAIEDSTHGVNAAIAAGMFCIGINTGNDRDALKNAHMIVDNYHQIDLEDLIYKKQVT